MDSNHGRRKPADLQSALVGHLSNSPKNTKKLVLTLFLKCIKWSWLRDLNPRPSAYKADALPTELSQQNRAKNIKILENKSRHCSKKNFNVKEIL